MTPSEQKAREIVMKLLGDQFRSDIDQEDSIDQAVSAIALSLREAEERAIAKEREFHPYLRIVDAFDKDATAAEFLREDGEGGFAGGVFRMARAIDNLRGLMRSRLNWHDENSEAIKEMRAAAIREQS